MSQNEEKGAKKETKSEKRSPTESAAHALSHRIRVKALIILVERVASPKQIADETGDRLQSVVYHVKILYDEGLIDLVDTKRRGAVTEHFYRAAVRPELTHDEWLELSDVHKKELSVIGVQNLFAECLGSIDEGCMQDDDEMYYWWKAPLYDRQAREELKREQDAHVARLLDIETRSNARVAQSGGRLTQIPTVIAVLGFQRGRPDPINEFELGKEM